MHLKKLLTKSFSIRRHHFHQIIFQHIKWNTTLNINLKKFLTKPLPPNCVKPLPTNNVTLNAPGKDVDCLEVTTRSCLP